MAQQLSPGFFDNKIEEARAKHEPYQDPAATMDVEWQKFQSVIAAETYHAENLVEEELEDIQLERTVDELDEQISSWQRIDNLQKRAEQLLTERTTAPNSSTTSAHASQRRIHAKGDDAVREHSSAHSSTVAAASADDDEDDDDEDLDSINDWRCKTSVKRRK